MNQSERCNLSFMGRLAAVMTILSAATMFSSSVLAADDGSPFESDDSRSVSAQRVSENDALISNDLNSYLNPGRTVRDAQMHCRLFRATANDDGKISEGKLVAEKKSQVFKVGVPPSFTMEVYFPIPNQEVVVSFMYAMSGWVWSEERSPYIRASFSIAPKLYKDASFDLNGSGSRVVLTDAVKPDRSTVLAYDCALILLN